MKYLDIAMANEQIGTIGIERKDKEGKVTVHDYALVNERIKAFRMVCPDGAIVTSLISNENGTCIFKATILDGDGNILGTGHAQEKEGSTFINKTSFVENCETSAIGRALGMCGFGIDVSIASAEEMQNALANQEMTKEDADAYTLTFGRNQGKTLKEIQENDPKYIEWILNSSKDERLLKAIELSLGIKIPNEDEQHERLEMIRRIMELSDEKDIDLEKVKEKFKVNELKEMTNEQMQKCIIAMERKENNEN